MSTMASQITAVSIVYSTVCSDTDQRKHQSFASLALCVGNAPVTGEFPTQRASNTENDSIWWRHNDKLSLVQVMAWHRTGATPLPEPRMTQFQFTGVFMRHRVTVVITLRPRQNGRHFPDDIFKYIFLNENVWIWLRSHWSFFLRLQLTIHQHWFR